MAGHAGRAVAVGTGPAHLLALHSLRQHIQAIAAGIIHRVGEEAVGKREQRPRGVVPERHLDDAAGSRAQRVRDQVLAVLGGGEFIGEPQAADARRMTLDQAIGPCHGRLYEPGTPRPGVADIGFDVDVQDPLQVGEPPRQSEQASVEWRCHRSMRQPVAAQRRSRGAGLLADRLRQSRRGERRVRVGLDDLVPVRADPAKLAKVELDQRLVGTECFEPERLRPPRQGVGDLGDRLAVGCQGVGGDTGIGQMTERDKAEVFASLLRNAAQRRCHRLLDLGLADLGPAAAVGAGLRQVGDPVAHRLHCRRARGRVDLDTGMLAQQDRIERRCIRQARLHQRRILRHIIERQDVGKRSCRGWDLQSSGLMAAGAELVEYGIGLGGARVSWRRRHRWRWRDGQRWGYGLGGRGLGGSRQPPGNKRQRGNRRHRRHQPIERTATRPVRTLHHSQPST